MAVKKTEVTIIGLGVMGGSLGMALLATGKYRVVGIDREPEAVKMALESRAISAGTTDYLEGIKKADIIVLAIPVGQVMELAPQISSFIPPGAIVTDVGSTKRELVRQLEKIFPHSFVGGHPMTGSEKSGISGADPYLFENAIYVLTPNSKTDPQALERIKKMVGDTGAILSLMSPDEHDEIVAAVSHLPHLLAVTLMNFAVGFSEKSPRALTHAAGGFRDMTRIAAGSNLMWKDIFATNRDHVLELSKQFRKILFYYEELLEQGEYDQFDSFILSASNQRQKIPFHLKGALPTLYELVCTVPDRPGSIALISSLLADQEINISDLEILRIREGEGGTMRLGFRTEREMERAFQILAKTDIPIKRR